MTSSILSQKKNILVQVPAAIITMALMVVLPLFVHLLPGIGATPLGAFLLPIYFAPLVAVFLFNPLVSIGAGLVVPYINYLLTGQPALPVAVGLSVELVIFSIAVLYFNRRKISGFWVVPAAFGLAKLGSGLVGLITGKFLLAGWFSGLIYAIPGLLILMLLYAWLSRQVNASDR